MTGAKAMLESLRKEKVEAMFGIPGGVIIPFYNEVLNNDMPRHILVRHEQGAAHAAEGFAKSTGKTGVCISTSGPGATNLVTGIADAYMDSVPVVAISGQVLTTAIGNDAFQEVDAFGLFMPITKYNFRIMRAQDIPETMKKAFVIASTGRPGPVHIDLPKDVQTNELDYEYPKEAVIPGYYPISPDPHPNQIKRAAELLLKAERPLILAGGGVIIGGAHQELARLAETLMIPVVTTLMGKGSIDEYHPLCLGFTGMHGRRVSNYALANCDVLLAVGARFSDRVTGDLNSFAKNTKIIHIDLDAAEIGKNVGVEIPIVSDSKKGLKAILDGVHRATKESEWTKKIKKYEKMCCCDYNFETEIPIKPQKVMYELNKILPKDAIICTEVGQNQMWAAHFIKVRTPRHFITSGGLGTMGFGLPAAMGAKVGNPDKVVVDIAGDGSVLMVIQELATTVSEDIPVIVVVMNNNWLGMVKQWQKLFLNKRYSATHLKEMPDFVKLAEAFGAKGERVVRPNELEGALKRALKSDVTYLIDVMIDPEEDALPMVPPGGNINKMILTERCPVID